MGDRHLTAQHENGTAPAPADVTKLRPQGRKSLILGVRIKCTDAANDLNVSFDNGANFYPVAANGGELVDNVLTKEVVVQGVGGTSDYAIILYTA